MVVSGSSAVVNKNWSGSAHATAGSVANVFAICRASSRDTASLRPTRATSESSARSTVRSTSSIRASPGTSSPTGVD